MGFSSSNNESFGVIAGSGALPKIVVDELQNKSIKPKVFCFDSENYAFFKKNKADTHKVSLEDLGGLIKLIKRERIKKAVCCGGVKFQSKIKLSQFIGGINFKIVACVCKALLSKQKGDNFLLSLAEEILRSINCKLVAVQDILPSILADKHDEINTFLAKTYDKDIEYGKDVLHSLSKYDIGQSIVIQEGRVLGIEGAEGTAELIKRCGTYASKKRKKPVLIKISKIGQNRKLDLPSIGKETVESLKAYNYAGLAIEDHSVIIIEKDVVLKHAKQTDIFLKVI